MEPAWGELVEQARGGSKTAFEQLYRASQPAVTARISHLLGPAGPVADLVQETFVQAYRNLHRFRGEAPFSHWVSRIATNVARAHLRRRRRRIWQLWSRPESEAQVCDPGGRVDAQLPDLQAVHRALDRLSLTLREAVLLYELEGLSLAQLAELQGVSLNTAASRVRRGRQKLRRHLEQLGFRRGAALAPVSQQPTRG